MSGIAGFWRFDSKKADASHLDQMLSAIRHRGPESLGTWCGEELHLGHRLTAATSERSPLPALHAPSGHVITADARLDNSEELASELGLEYSSHPPDPAARDAEVILAAYRKWSIQCPDRLLGDFAFTIWDPGKRRLFLARDPFGIRPLLYFHSPEFFAFGSEAKALFAHPDIPKELNRARLADYLVPGLESLSFDSTFFKNIYRLPPGSTMTITPETSQPQPKRWFYLKVDRPQLRLSRDRDYEEAFLEQFTAATDRCLRRPGNVGSMLSGGLDSSSVCAVAQRLLADRGAGDLPVFSAVSSDSPVGPETVAIEAVIRQTGVDPHRLLSDEIGKLDVETMAAIRQSDDPFDFQITIIPALFAAAAQAGCTTLMTGVDGDISAGVSRRYLIYQLRSGQVFPALRETIGLARNSDCGWRGAADLFAFSLRSVIAPRSTRSRHRKIKLAEQLSLSMIRREFAAEVGIADRLGQLYDYNQPVSEPLSLRDRHAALIQSSMLTVALERYDRAAQRFSVETAHPFLDRRLVEFALVLPENQRARDGWSKWILRRAIGNRLPEEARWRRENQNVNWQFANAALLNLTKTSSFSVSDPFSRVRPFIDPEQLPGSTNHGCLTDGHELPGRLRRALILSLWLEEHFPTS